MWAVWIQAIATVLLVFITYKYVRHTKELVDHSRDSVAEAARAVDQAAHLANEERRQRKRLTFLSLKLEIEDCMAACRPQGSAHPAVRLPTHVWDTMKGDLAFLSSEQLETISEAYRHIRRCNMHYDRTVMQSSPSEPGRWIDSAKETRKCLEGAVALLREIESAGLGKLLA